ncbi:MAG: hypothetical protein UU95_C0038G0006 [Parcubacteria group bacterium GW2011_GWC2_42_12]|nr:MAG: hypothetical protein UU95_C0038G0006 [Parcubacteria group bacterium GW2011_GWC2_42_12]
MKVVVLSALGNAVAQRCISSLLETTTAVDFDLYLVREKRFREQTLNQALLLTGTDEDVLFVGDDIEFTPGWYEALMANYDQADILGMSMLYPGTTKVQDCGYDLVQIDELISLEAKDRGLSKGQIEPFAIRSCDALCGCFMLVKANVFAYVSSFSEEGQNRWGEFVFISQARQHRATVSVIDHFLYHYGKSTKSNPDKLLSSTSYHIERSIWQDILHRYIDPADIRIRMYSVLEENFLARLQDSTLRILFYGIGTVTEFILNKVQPKEDYIAFCSGLPEERGLDFRGQKILSIDEVAFSEFDWVLITPLYIGEKLYHEVVLPCLPQGFKGIISIVAIETTGEERVYFCRDISPFKGAITGIHQNHERLR